MDVVEWNVWCCKKTTYWLISTTESVRYVTDIYEQKRKMITVNKRDISPSRPPCS